jgi:hypothetical protein
MIYDVLGIGAGDQHGIGTRVMEAELVQGADPIGITIEDIVIHGAPC